MSYTLPYQVISTKHLQHLYRTIAGREADIQSAAAMIRSIASGAINLQNEQQLPGTDNVLIQELATMRSRMAEMAELDRQRNWMAEGLTLLADRLRQHQSDPVALGNSLIQHLVKYLGANQGALFMLDEEANTPELALIACYAYERQKYKQKTIAVGQGLPGQAVLEKDSIYLTDIPQNYVSITSGLGDATPSYLLITPLLFNEEVLGVVEVASFQEIKPYQRKFVEKAGESIAAALETMRTGRKTSLLLKESQTQTETLRAQEEEMRQTMEELTSTQEETHRLLNQVQQKEAFYNAILNAAQDVIVTFDREHRITYFNDAFRATNSAKALGVTPGFDAMVIIPEELREIHRHHMNQALNGQATQITERFKNAFTDIYYTFSHFPLKDAEGNVFAGGVMIKNVTELMLAKLQAEQLLETSQQVNQRLTQRENQLKAQMEKSTRLDQMLLALRKHAAVTRGEWNDALRLLTQTLTHELGVHRAGVWTLDAEQVSITNECVFELTTRQVSSGTVLKETDFPEYFAAVRSESVIIATDATTHPATAGFTDVYLNPLGIRSMLDVPYFVEGVLKGVFCLEHNQVKEWDDKDVAFVSGIAELLASAFQVNRRKTLEAELLRCQQTR